MSRISEIKRRFRSSVNTGFGNNAGSQGDRLLNRDGSFNVHRTGQNILQKWSPYHQLITISWTHFNLIILSGFIFLNLAFTLLFYLAGTEELSGLVHTDLLNRFIEIFTFSAQTLTTVGYGRVSPVGSLSSLLASLESLLGLMSFALVTGLLYGRFSRPHAKLLYSENAVIAPYKNGTALMFRIANARKNQLIECEATVMFNYHDPETGNRRFINLELEFAKINALSLSWTIVHPIDEKSPLFGLSYDEFLELKAEVLLLFKAFDDTYSQQIHTRLSYAANEFVWGAKFVPMYRRSEDGKTTLLELNKIGQYQLVTLPDSNS